MLTSDQIQTIVREVMHDLPISVKGNEAEEFAVALEQDIALAKKNNWTIELPFEIPDLSTDEK